MQKAISAAAGRSRYLGSARNRSTESFEYLAPVWGKRLLLLDATLYQASVLFLLELIAVHGLHAKGFGPRERTPRRAAQKNEREESVCLLVFGLAIGKAGQPAEASPIRSAWIGLVSTGQFLGDKRGDGSFVGPMMLQPCLEVPGTGFDNRTRLEAVRGQAVNGFLRKIVQNGQIVNSRWTDVDVGSARVLALQELGLGQDRLFCETCVTGKHAPVARECQRRRWLRRAHRAFCEPQ